MSTGETVEGKNGTGEEGFIQKKDDWRELYMFQEATRDNREKEHVWLT